MPTPKNPKTPKKGRPKGATGPAKAKERVQKFTPRRDQVVLLHLSGMSHGDIAKLTRYTPQRVYELLTDPIAVKLIEEGRAKIISGMLQNIDGRLVQLANRSLDNIQKTVDAKISALHPAKRHQDKLGIDLLRMIGYGESRANTDQGGSLTNEMADRLSRALERSDRVQGIDVTKEVPMLEAEIVAERKAS